MSFFRPETSPDLAASTAELLKLPKFGDGPGLHRMLQLVEPVRDSDWWRSIEAIKITGSKGKGSTSALIASILRGLGVSAGLYTSPHLVQFAERIQVGLQPIPGEELIREVRAALAARAEYEARNPQDRIGAFEVFTAIAFRYFAAKATDTIVSEAGIGGRFDSTRILPGSLAALTSVELEHAELLGRSLDLIAFDKADLCPDHGTLVAGVLPSDVLRRLRGYCAVRNVELVAVEEVASVSACEYRDGWMDFQMTCDGMDFGLLSSRLPGQHQAWNAAIAVAAVRRWLARTGRSVDPATLQRAVREALRTVEWPGRFQRVSASPDIVMDVGHTPQSIQGVARTVRLAYPDRPVLLVTGVSIDKDAAGILQELLPAVDAVVCTRAYHKGRPAADIAALCRQIRPDLAVETRERIEDAVEVARLRAARDAMVLLIAGGLFLAVEATVSLQGGDPASLQFF